VVVDILPNCSISPNKASQGLFVPSTHFTPVSSRLILFRHVPNTGHTPNRSIFHAGHYLCDKELCYLRTVIVTANVYFSTSTGHISFPTIKNLKLPTMFLLNSHFVTPSSSILSKSHVKFQVFAHPAPSYFSTLIHHARYLPDKKTYILT